MIEFDERNDGNLISCLFDINFYKKNHKRKRGFQNLIQFPIFRFYFAKKIQWIYTLKKRNPIESGGTTINPYFFILNKYMKSTTRPPFKKKYTLIKTKINPTLFSHLINRSSTQNI